MTKKLIIEQVLPNGTTRHEELTIGDGDKILMQYPETMTMQEIDEIWEALCYVLEYDGNGIVAIPDTISLHVLHVGDEE